MLGLAFVALVLSAPNKKKRTGGVPILGARKTSSHAIPHTPEEKAELASFLKELGFPQYATPSYLETMERELAYDSISDLTFLEEDEDYLALGMPEADAETIQEAAHKEMLRRFLAGLPSGSMEQHLDRLVENGYEEIEDLEDLDVDDDEVRDLALSKEQIRMLLEAAQLNAARQILTVFIVTLKEAGQAGQPPLSPFREPAVHEPMVDKLLAAGVRSLYDLRGLQPGSVAGLADGDLAKLQADRRVVHATLKTEL